MTVSPLQIIMLGAPGSGKGTQAKKISEHYQIPHISTGDLLRNNPTPEVKKILDSGAYVPDSVMISMIKEALNKTSKGWILDGFPRTLPQAETLDTLLQQPATALFLKVPDLEIQNRLGLRRICPNCQAIYHLEEAKPKVEGICDKCQTTLAIRNDDKPEVVAERLRIYYEKTAPLIDRYQKKGSLIEIDGGGGKTPLQIFSLIKESLKKTFV